MAITLTKETEARLRTIAQQRGADPEETLLALLSPALASAEEQETLLAELQESADDHDAGRSMTIEEYRAKTLLRRQKRDAQTLPSAGQAA